MPSPQVPMSQQVATDSNGLFTFVWYTYFQSLYKSIRGALNLKLGGLLNMNFSPASNVSSTATNLLSYSLQLNTIVNNGDLIEIKGFGVFAGNSNGKEIVLKFGSQTIYDSTSLTVSGGSWSINATIIRLTDTTQEILVESFLNNTATTTRTAGTQNLNSVNNIQFIGTGSVSADITQTALYVKLTPNDQ